MRVFKSRQFARDAEKFGLKDPQLLTAVAEAERGLLDADLGGGVVKQRIARQGEGKSGGFRTVILFKRGELAFFVYVFAKNERDNITRSELNDFRKLASIVLTSDVISLHRALPAGDWIEIHEEVV